MSMITKPIILDETGRQIASILEGIRDAISAKSVDVPNMPGVKFIDYDGTVVYFAGRGEVLHMKKLPDAPVHVDLTAQGWNWSLADIKTYMTKYPDAVMTVGQMYIPADGKTHMILDVGPRLTIPLMIQQTVSEGVTINWGDGSDEETIEGTGTVTTSHTYEAEGEYEITLEVADGCTLDFGGTVDETDCNVFGESTTRMYKSLLRQAFIGSGVTSIGRYAFLNCGDIINITIPDGVTTIEMQGFASCYILPSLIIPVSVTTIGASAFANCYALNDLSIPDDVISINAAAFYNCYNIKNLLIPDSVTSIGQQAFSGCMSLTELVISDKVASIELKVFNSCYVLYTLTILAETPPTLANVNAFNNMPADCTIYVPHGKGDTYKAASGWSTWASQIQELPE